MARGGRYDEVGKAVFGRTAPRHRLLASTCANWPAPPRPREAARTAIRRARASERRRNLREEIAALRGRGETVVCVLPGHESEVDEFHCDRELAQAAGQWVVKAI